MESLLISIIPTQLSELLVFMLAVILTFYIKDTVAGIVKGIAFVLGSTFNQGDQVYIDGERATIISVGITKTIFEVENGRGKTWLIVYNTEIPRRKIEKIIEPKEVHLIKRRRKSDKVENNANDDN